MNLKNGYKALYEIIEDRGDSGKYRIFKASKSGTFTDTEKAPTLLEAKIGTYKLVYEKDGKIYGSTTSIPNITESSVNTDFCFSDEPGFDEVFESPILSTDSTDSVDKNDANSNAPSVVLFSRPLTFESLDEGAGGYVTTEPVTDFPEFTAKHYIVNIDDGEDILCYGSYSGGAPMLTNYSDTFIIGFVEGMTIFVTNIVNLQGEHTITIKSSPLEFIDYAVCSAKTGFEVVSFELPREDDALSEGITLTVTDSEGNEYLKNDEAAIVGQISGDVCSYGLKWEIPEASPEYYAKCESIFNAIKNGKQLIISVILTSGEVVTLENLAFNKHEDEYNYECYYAGQKSFVISE